MKINTYCQIGAILLSTLFIACEETDNESNQFQAGDLVKAEAIQQYSAVEITQIMALIGIANPIPIPVEAVKLTYYSQMKGQGLIKLTGAIILPNDNATHSLLSIQHGTVTKRSNVASVNPLNSSAGISGLLTAALGYVTLIPDYAGFGDSDIMHPYIHAESLANSVVDMLKAATSYCEDHDINLNGKLFLSGYSEGGYASLAAQRLIESEYFDNFPITAVAPMAGSYDLYVTAQEILATGNYSWPAYIGFLFTAYDELYGFDKLDVVFKEPYAHQMPNYYDGSYEFFEINQQLPQTFTDLFNPEFLEAFTSGTEQDFSNAFRENGLLDWSPVAPVRLYHGMLDSTVPYYIAELTADSLKANGAIELELVGIPDANHSTAGLPAILNMIDWFSTF